MQLFNSAYTSLTASNLRCRRIVHRKRRQAQSAQECEPHPQTPPTPTEKSPLPYGELTRGTSRNSTTIPFATSAPGTYWGQFEEISKYNVSLNYLERLWLAWYTYMQNDVLATGILSFTMHELVYFGRSLPWIIIDQIPLFNKYKIQNVSAAAAARRDSLQAALLTRRLAKNTHGKGAVAVRVAGPPEPLHRRASPDMV